MASNSKLIATFMLIENITTLVTTPGSGDIPKTTEDCQSKYIDLKKNVLLKVPSYCNTVFDKYLCWPPTIPGTTIQQLCPSGRLIDTKRYASRRCREDSLWEGRHSNEGNKIGWTNYSNCFPTYVQGIFVEGFNDDYYHLTKYAVAERSRYIEITGYIISFIAIVVALYIFKKFRIIQNVRNRIHTHLFYSLLFETILHLVIILDQYIIRDSVTVKTTSYKLKGIDNTPTICEVLYVMAEYSVAAVYSWIFIEGLHLNYLISNKALQPFHFKTYCICGWTVPLILTSIWTIVVWISYKKESVNECWFGYNLKPSYWILQGPRVGVILCNAVILVRVMKMVIKKLKEAKTPENLKIKKSVKAALFLLPILGISNVLSIFDISIYANIYIFMAFCYTRQLIKSFQGFLLTLIYCVGNEEVRAVVLRRMRLFAWHIDWLAYIRWLHPRRLGTNPMAISPAGTLKPTMGEGTILSVTMSDNKNEYTRRSTFWLSFGKVFCINQCTRDSNDYNLEDNNSAIAMLPINESETETASQEKLHRRFAIGPNLPIFFNCLRRGETASQKQEDMNAVRLGNRLKNYNDDSESPLCELTRQRQQAAMKPVAGPNNDKDTAAATTRGKNITRKRKLAKRRNLRVTFASPEQASNNLEKKSPSVDHLRAGIKFVVNLN